MDIDTALRTFRMPDLANYPELAGYTREQIYDETIGGGALYLAARMVRTMDLQPLHSYRAGSRAIAQGDSAAADAGGIAIGRVEGDVSIDRPRRP